MLNQLVLLVSREVILFWEGALRGFHWEALCPIPMSMHIACVIVIFYCLIFLLHIVKSFIEIVELVFNIPDVQLFLSNRLCQDPLEKLFGQQRQRGRASENPNARDFVKNTQALRVVHGVCRDVKGNCRGSKTTNEHENM